MFSSGQISYIAWAGEDTCAVSVPREDRDDFNWAIYLNRRVCQIRVAREKGPGSPEWFWEKERFGEALRR